jgi:hypothetical protein
MSARKGKGMITAPVIHTSGAAFVNQAGQQVILRGLNLAASAKLPSALDKLGPFNLVRLRISWPRLEPSAGGFDSAYVAMVDGEIRQLAARHVSVIIDWHYTGRGVQPPAWAGFSNSTWWTSQAKQDLYAAMLRQMVAHWSAYPNVIGYEPWNEPHPDTAAYATLHAATQAELRWMARMATAIRSVDPQRAIIVMARGGWDYGLRHADLGVFGKARHLVLSFHDPYCGCAPLDGFSRSGEDASRRGATNDHIWPYAGTYASQKAHLAFVLRWRTVLNRPIIVSEWEARADDPNATTYGTQLLLLMRRLGLSWAHWYGAGKWSLDGAGAHRLSPQGEQLRTAFVRGAR